MPLPKPYGEEGWLQVYRALLPTGPFWDAYCLPGGEGEGVLRGRAKVFAAYESRLYLLLSELIPSGAVQSLAAREGEAGLPSCCSASISESLSARVGEVVSVWNGRGGIHADYYIELAAGFGAVDSTVTAFNAYTCEMDCETAVFDESWHNVWRLNAPEVPVYELSCESGCEEPLRLWGNERLECEVNRKKPSGTHVFVGYGG